MIKNVLVVLVVFCQIIINITQHGDDGLMYLHMLDVGQGDAFLLRTPDKKYILVDGGPTSELIDVMSKYMPFWQNQIDLVIATHGDSDHIGGLVELSERYAVNRFIYNGETKNTLIYKELINNITEDNINVTIAKKGQEIIVGCCTKIDVLWPDSSEIEDSNDQSVSILLKYGNFEAYLAGDLGYKYEEIISKSLVGDIEVMKLSHHGSRTSTSSKVLDRINPEIALISAGRDNKFGHPHQEVINLLDKNKIIQFRTDMHGTVSVRSDGENYDIETENGNK
ncbi:MAG TPA: MBL fold metallo-hydrolase [Candidatus Dojkabacteria bacterium]|nr:MBL fold metallo-hydrolase [Candidatus Dojkabacteria bacterium]